jgi:hypothetical protein
LSDWTTMSLYESILWWLTEINAVLCSAVIGVLLILDILIIVMNGTPAHTAYIYIYMQPTNLLMIEIWPMVQKRLKTTALNVYWLQQDSAEVKIVYLLPMKSVSSSTVCGECISHISHLRETTEQIWLLPNVDRMVIPQWCLI